MKRALTVVQLALWVAAAAGKKQAVQQPNLVMLVVDDLGAGDVSFASKDMAKSTPHLSQLAEEGVVLSNFYASPECTPSRAMLLTGRHSIHTGLQDSVIHGTEPRGVALDEVMLPSLLADRHNYKTVAIGKWHCGFHQTGYLPRSRGFDSFFGILTGGGNHFTHVTTEAFSVRGSTERVHSVSGYNLWEDDAPVAEQPGDDVHSTTLYNQRAVTMVQKHDFASQPLFMYLSWQAVHGPMQVEARFMDATTVDNGCTKISASTTDVEDADVNLALRPRLCGMMSMVDEGVGQLRDALVARGQWERSVVVFLSDNGGVKRHGSSNAPFKGQKGEYFEGGVHVPALFGGGFLQQSLAQNGMPGGRTCERLFHITDLFSTLLRVAAGSSDAADLAGLPNPVDGIDQWDTIVAESTTAVQRDHVLINMNSDMWGGGGAMVMGKYKMIVENSVGDSVLYNAGRAFMADKLTSSTGLDELLSARREELFEAPVMHLYDLSLNPSEDDSGACDQDVAVCSNLWEHPDYADVQSEFMQRWADMQGTMVSSNEEWKDDGPLADPALYGGTWSPWLDDAGMPYALYYLTP